MLLASAGAGLGPSPWTTTLEVALLVLLSF